MLSAAVHACGDSITVRDTASQYLGITGANKIKPRPTRRIRALATSSVFHAVRADGLTILTDWSLVFPCGNQRQVVGESSEQAGSLRFNKLIKSTKVVT